MKQWNKSVENDTENPILTFVYVKVKVFFYIWFKFANLN